MSPLPWPFGSTIGTTRLAQISSSFPGRRHRTRSSPSSRCATCANNTVYCGNTVSILLPMQPGSLSSGSIFPAATLLSSKRCLRSKTTMPSLIISKTAALATGTKSNSCSQKKPQANAKREQEKKTGVKSSPQGVSLSKYSKYASQGTKEARNITKTCRQYNGSACRHCCKKSRFPPTTAKLK